MMIIVKKRLRRGGKDWKDLQPVGELRFYLVKVGCHGRVSNKTNDGLNCNVKVSFWMPYSEQTIRDVGGSGSEARRPVIKRPPE